MAILKKRFSNAVLLSVLIFSTCLGSGAQTRIQLDKYAGNLKTIQVRISDQYFNFLFDTGGGETIISPDIAKMIGRPVYGVNTGFRMHGERVEFRRCDDVLLQIGDIDFRFRQVAVWDVMSILPTDFPKIDGILSLHSFSKHKLTIDLQNSRLFLEDNSSFKKRIRVMTPVAAVFTTGLDGREVNLFFDIPIGKKTYRLLFDSGNIDKTKLAPTTAQALGLNQDMKEQNRTEIGDIGLLVGGRPRKASAVIESTIYEGVLDFKFISQSIYTIDFITRRVWIQ